MLTNYIPDTWQDIQTKVAEILQNCGFDVQVEQKFGTARGQVEIDVFAEENVKGRKYAIICECKFWKANIPQNVVHGVRTVVSDLGYNIGYIITTSDFQSGAFKAAGYSNVELLTWAGFQELFFDTWYEASFTIQITKQLDPLLTYSEPFLPRWFDQMSADDQDAFMALKDNMTCLAI